MKYLNLFICIIISFAAANLFGQNKSGITTYKNPIIHADLSDPDVIRVGDDFYMIASSFNAVPALPILHSKDLVNWHIISYALQQLQPTALFDKPQHGNGVWAPAIRVHKNEFYIFYPDPDQGIFMIKSKNIYGPWSAPILVEAGKGLIDPCPFWDTDGKVYLVHAYAGSRAGFKSILVLKQLNSTSEKVIGNGILIYDGHDIDPTIEGPKIYKRNQYYYVFAPAGGVETGWQTVLRSKQLTGPYERKIVMGQGASKINGPHQGAWVQLKNGEDWFLHFQDKGAYGRIVHLQPMQWKQDWPVIGSDADGDGTGEPVMKFNKPKTEISSSNFSIQVSDEFDTGQLGLQWQWQANPKPGWAFCYPAKGALRLNAVLQADSSKNLWGLPNMLLQKLPAENFESTLKFSFKSKTIGERFGFIVMGRDYAYLSLLKKEDGNYITFNTCIAADNNAAEIEKVISKIDSEVFYFRIQVNAGAICSFKYSEDGKVFETVPEKFTAKAGKWIGAKMGFFCNRILKTNDAGFADLDWLRITK